MRFRFTLLFFLFTVSVGAQKVSMQSFRKAGMITSSAHAETFPIHIWNDFILIDAEINGVKGTFIWDNGLSFCALDSVFAAKAGVRFDRRKRDSVIDGNDKMLELEAQYAHKIKIGGFMEEYAPVFGLNIDNGFFKNRERKISGLIGSGFSNHFNWSFDFDHNTVTISSKPFSKQGIPLKYIIDTFNNLHYLPINVNGAGLYAQVDFGMVGEVFSGTNQLLPAFNGHPIIASVGYNSLSAGGLSRMDTIYTIRKDYRYTISGQSLKELPDIELSGIETDFKIGVRFFMHYNVMVNNSDSAYILTSRLTPLPSKTKKSYGVLVLKKGSDLIIGRLTNNPNLAGKNVQLLDKVKTINNEPTVHFYGLIDLRDFQEN